MTRPATGLAMRLALTLALAAAPALPVRAGEAFDLLRFFEGASASRGTIRTFGLFEEPFEARFRGVRESDGSLRLDERFRFAAGERLQRWHLRRVGDRLTGTVETQGRDGRLAAPVPVEGTLGPGVATLDYRGRAPGGGATVFRFQHRIAPDGDGTATNRVRVSKFGLPLARSLVTFFKAPPPPAAR